jgi:hypothetical protein
MTDQATYPLRLPRFLQEAVANVAQREGTTIDQFIAIAVAEKLSALDTQTFFEERRQKADFAAFDRIMSRSTGEPPRPGDEMPADPSPDAD